MVRIDSANHEYNSVKKAYVARITGRAPGKLVFEREFVGGEYGASVDAPGLYEARSIGKKGTVEDEYFLVGGSGAPGEDSDAFVEIDRERAMTLAKKANPDWQKEFRSERIKWLEMKITAAEAKVPSDTVNVTSRIAHVEPGLRTWEEVLAGRRTQLAMLTAKPPTAARLKQIQQVRDLMEKLDVTVEDLKLVAEVAP